MENNRQSAVEYLRNNREDLIERLGEFIRIPSISTEPEHRQDVDRAAEWLARQLRSLDLLEVEIFPTAGAPVVYGSTGSEDPEAPTLLIYGHNVTD